MAVTRKKIRTILTHAADGTVAHIEVRTQLTQDNPDNPAIQLTDEERIQIGLDDMTAGDKTSATAFSARIEAMAERKRPLVVDP